MSRLPENFIQEVIAKNDIVDVIGSYITLKRNGANYWGLCPFHHEKTSSFSVAAHKQFFHCFGCKESGSVIQFVMKIENLDFLGAVEFLARRMNIAMPEPEDDKEYSDRKKLREKLYEINKEAAKHFHDNLMSAEGEHARAYLKNRGIDERVATRFGLGFALNSFDNMLNHLTSKGFIQTDMIAADLARKKERGAYDTFRNRVIFPIIDTFGNVIAFGGRVMDDSTPKYLNSSDTAAFNKRRNLYALNIVKKQRTKTAVLLEGYIDVISLNAAGAEGTVASLGTSFTKEQAFLLKRFCENVYVCYDGDFAGRHAALKASDILEEAGLNARVITIEDGLDPDDFVRRYGLLKFKDKMKSSLTPMDFKLDMLKIDYDLSTLEGKTAYSIEAAKLIKNEKSPVRLENYLKRVQKETGFSYSALERQLRSDGSDENSIGKERHNIIHEDMNTASKAEEVFIRCVLNNSEQLKYAADTVPEDYLKSPLHIRVYELLKTNVKKGVLLSNAELLTMFFEQQEVSALGAMMAQDDSYDDEMFKNAVLLLKAEMLSRQREKILTLINGGDSDLIKELSQIDKQIFETKQLIGK